MNCSSMLSPWHERHADEQSVNLGGEALVSDGRVERVQGVLHGLVYIQLIELLEGHRTHIGVCC